MSYTRTKNTIERQNTERGQLQCQLLLVLVYLTYFPLRQTLSRFLTFCSARQPPRVPGDKVTRCVGISIHLNFFSITKLSTVITNQREKDEKVVFQLADRNGNQGVHYGGPQLSRQNQKPHAAKTKYLTAKPKTSRQNQNTSRQNEKPHGNTKYFTAINKYLTAKANTHGKTTAILLLL